ncbi:MAG: hypothetical protein IJ519_00675 [Clostridia bacterium]|nr:hypothetical protein [Clostridia bacterium]
MNPNSMLTVTEKTFLMTLKACEVSAEQAIEWSEVMTDEEKEKTVDLFMENPQITRQELTMGMIEIVKARNS